MKKKSIGIFFIVFTLVIISFQTIIYGSFFKKVENDAKIINDLGIIRGSIQRFSKLELISKSDSSINKRIDDLFLYYLESKQNKDVLQIDIFKHLYKEWQELNILIENYREYPSYENQNLVVEKSEYCWKVADELVLDQQHIAQKEISYFKYFIIGIGINIIVIFIEYAVALIKEI